MRKEKEILAYLNQDTGRVAAFSDEDPVDEMFDKDDKKGQPWTKQEGQNDPMTETPEDNSEPHIEDKPAGAKDLTGEDPHKGDDKSPVNMDSVPPKLGPFGERKVAVAPAAGGGIQNPGLPQVQQGIQTAPLAPLPTKEQLLNIARFAGQLAAAAEGLKNVVNPDSAVVKMNQQGGIVVKVPLGPNPSIPFELVKELADDVKKGLYGNLKVLGLQNYQKIAGVQLQAGAAMKHEGLRASHFVLAFEMSPGTQGAPGANQQKPGEPDPAKPI